jgi:hypothetical protein
MACAGVAAAGELCEDAKANPCILLRAERRLPQKVRDKIVTQFIWAMIWAATMRSSMVRG